MNFKKVTIETTVKGDHSKIWDAWTQPVHITKWNFASDDWCCPKAEVDLRVDGRYMARMEAKDGSFGFDFEGIYKEVATHKKLVFSMTDGRTATTQFEQLGGKTKITTVFDAENQNPIELQREGWQAILNNFKKYVEG